MHDFTLAAIGGLLIGSSAVLLLSQLGRIAGISGILWHGLNDLISRRTIPWQGLFIVGLIGGAYLAHSVFNIPIPTPSSKGPVIAIIAGLLVGFGTNFGNGCTSGHGVCGIGRLSIRSLTATITFMLAGVVTVYVANHLLGVTL